MDFFNVVTLETAIECLCEGLQLKKTIERIDFKASLGRLLAEPIIAKENLPAYNRSTVDGYGVHWEDVQGASDAVPTFLSCVGQVAMGTFYEGVIQRGECLYIPTGGMIPEGVDGVVMVEYSELLGDLCLIKKPISVYDNSMQVGDDVHVGTVVLEANTVMTPAAIGILAGLGEVQIPVYKQPTFTLIATGDEIIHPSQAPISGQIRDMNSYSVGALIESCGGRVVERRAVSDDPEQLLSALKKALAQADYVILSGGSSVGTMDYTTKIIEALESGRVLVHGLAMKPGKPTIIGDCKGQKIIGLPGHPAAALLVAMCLLKPLIACYTGQDSDLKTLQARLTHSVHGTPGRDTYQMVTLITDETGQLDCVPIFAKSGMMHQLIQGDGYIIIKADQEGVEKNAIQTVYLYR